MAELFSNKSRLERRLKELRKESGLVKEDIRALSRALREPDELEQLPRLRSGKYERRAPVRPPSRPDPVAPPPAAQPPPSHVPQATHPSHSVPLSHAMPPKVSAMAAGGLAEPRAAAVSPRKAVEGDGRFRKLFSSGGFFGTAHYREEQNVQRNKAVFMLMIVAVFLMIVYRLIFQ